MADTKSVSEQKSRAAALFIGLMAVFGICVYCLLAVQYEYWEWMRNLETIEQKNSLEPLKWVFASLIGATIYLLSEIAQYYSKIDDKAEGENRDDFKGYTFWYISTLIKAPILTVVVMWLLINLKINVGEGEKLGITVDFSKFSDVVKIGIAFILGFYGRVTRKQLDIIAKYLFTRAWALAEQGFEVALPPQGIILLKEKYTFKTDPVTDVVWTANVGTMEADTGTYTAPDDLSNDGKKVIIRAALKNEPSVTGFKEVELKLFKIKGATEVKSGDKVSLTVETNMTDKVTENELKAIKWEAPDDASITFSPNPEKTTEFTAPQVEKKDGGKSVKVKATLTHDNKPYSAELTITVKPKE
ncbi:MAG: hypothetical protein HZB19_20055 [Chloroflexi bacterium]|nr:hypothetical protein [Chloroflexota bacterium]